MNKSRILVTALTSLLVLTAFGAAALAQDAGLDPFQAQVDAGELPPLAERLPTNPLVVGPGLLVSLEDQPEWEPGAHGGTLRTAFTSAFGFSGEMYVMNLEPIIAAPGIDVEGFYGNVAETFTVNEDATVFSFTLREGLRWSDGEPVTTEDVAFVFNDLYNNEEYGSFPNKFRSATGTPAQLDVMDDHSFSLTFDSPSGGILRDLAITAWTSYNDMIKPLHYLADYHPAHADGDELAAKLAAEGLEAGDWPVLFNNVDCPRNHMMREKCIGFPQLTPWLVSELSESGTIMSRNPYYWKVDTEGKQLPYLDRLVAQVFGDGEMVNLGAIAGDIDFLYGTQYSNFPLYKENEEAGNYVTIPLILHADPTALYIQTCNRDPAWHSVASDVRFRRALSHAIDREEIIDVVYLGLGSVPTWVPAAFDPDTANALLDEMGMDGRDGAGMRMAPDGSEFSFIIEVSPVRPDMIPVGELMIDHLATYADLRVELRQEDPNVKNERIRNNETQTSIFWIQTYQWRPGMNQEYAGSSQWCASWREWLNTGGASGDEPPAEVKRLYEILVARKATIPYSEADLALVDELFQLHYDNVWILPMIENVLRPTIFNADFGNIASGGTQMGASRAGEQFFYRQPQ